MTHPIDVFRWKALVSFNDAVAVSDTFLDVMTSTRAAWKTKGAGGSCSDTWPILLPNDFFGGKTTVCQQGHAGCFPMNPFKGHLHECWRKGAASFRISLGEVRDVFATGRRLFSTPKIQTRGDSNNSARPKVVQPNRHAIFWLSSFRCKSVCVRV